MAGGAEPSVLRRQQTVFVASGILRHGRLAVYCRSGHTSADLIFCGIRRTGCEAQRTPCGLHTVAMARSEMSHCGCPTPFSHQQGWASCMRPAHPARWLHCPRRRWHNLQRAKRQRRRACGTLAGSAGRQTLGNGPDATLISCAAELSARALHSFRDKN